MRRYSKYLEEQIYHHVSFDIERGNYDTEALARAEELASEKGTKTNEEYVNLKDYIYAQRILEDRAAELKYPNILARENLLETIFRDGLMLGCVCIVMPILTLFLGLPFIALDYIIPLEGIPFLDGIFEFIWQGFEGPVQLIASGNLWVYIWFLVLVFLASSLREMGQKEGREQAIHRYQKLLKYYETEIKEDAYILGYKDAQNRIKPKHKSTNESQSFDHFLETRIIENVLLQYAIKGDAKASKEYMFIGVPIKKYSVSEELEN